VSLPQIGPTPWAISHPVIELMRRRREAGYQAGADDDGHKLGLAIEGGGMRGIVSASMVSAVEELGFAPVVDAVYAASSGAMNAVYFLAGATWYPLSIYYDDLVGRQFIDFRRPLRGKPILNLKYALDDVLNTLKPLNAEAVLKSPTELNIAITLVDRLQTLVLNSFEDKNALVEALRASTWLPIALPGTATWRGERALDGGVLTAHPFSLAFEAGCTHVLSLSTKPLDRQRASEGAMQRIAHRHMERLRRGLGDGYVAALKRHVRERAELEERRFDTARPPYVLDLAPLAGMPEVKRHETNPGRLINAARQAYAVAYCALEQVEVAGIWDLSVRVIPRFTVVRNGMPTI
jgi:predicted patatin/cPLA2 family phospholipase